MNSLNVSAQSFNDERVQQDSSAELVEPYDIEDMEESVICVMML